MRRSLTTFLPLLLSTVLLSSCRSPRPTAMEVSKASLPEQYSRAEAGVQSPDRWWLDFGSRDLENLMAQAFAQNLTIAETEARLRQAVAEARKAGAALVPDISATAGAGVSRVQANDGLVDNTTREYSLGLAASYELDLWGRVRQGRLTFLKQAEASRRDLEAAAATLAGNVAETWLRILEQDAQIELLERQLETNTRQLDLLKLRQLKAQAIALDIYQQEQIVASTEALIPQSRAEARVLRNQLALLIGRAAGTSLALSESALPSLPDVPELGLPADLLEKRPDIRAALDRLEAAEAAVRVARADRLPAIRLTGKAAYNSDSLDTLFDNWILNLAAGLTAPLLDGGRRSAELDRTRAITDERLAAYRRVVLTAFGEVENALARETQQREQLAALERQLAFARDALRESEKRYMKGASDYLPVLTALASVQRLERSVLSGRRELLVQRVALYRALGGRWTSEEADRLATEISKKQ